MPTLVHIERSEFRQGEIPHVVPPVVAVTGWKPRFDIGDPVEVQVMQYYEFVVRRRDNVLLEEIGAHADGESLGFQSVLGQIAGRAAMGDDNWPFGRCRQGEDLTVSADETDTASGTQPSFRENQ